MDTLEKEIEKTMPITKGVTKKSQKSIEDVNPPLHGFPSDLVGCGSGDPRTVIEPCELNQAQSSESDCRKFVVESFAKSDFEKAATERKDIRRIWKLWSDYGTIFRSIA